MPQPTPPNMPQILFDMPDPTDKTNPPWNVANKDLYDWLKLFTDSIPDFITYNEASTAYIYDGIGDIYDAIGQISGGSNSFIFSELNAANVGAATAAQGGFPTATYKTVWLGGNPYVLDDAAVAANGDGPLDNLRFSESLSLSFSEIGAEPARKAALALPNGAPFLMGGSVFAVDDSQIGLPDVTSRNLTLDNMTANYTAPYGASPESLGAPKFTIDEGVLYYENIDGAVDGTGLPGVRVKDFTALEVGKDYWWSFVYRVHLKQAGATGPSNIRAFIRLDNGSSGTLYGLGSQSLIADDEYHVLTIPYTHTDAANNWGAPFFAVIEDSELSDDYGLYLGVLDLIPKDSINAEINGARLLFSPDENKAEKFRDRQSIPTNRRIELIAHRGFRNQGPQNTMMAFSSALQEGADALECDVQVSSDGKLYVFHDGTVDALTNGTGEIKNLTSAQVDALIIDEVAGTKYSSEKIPRFEDFLAFARERGVKVYPEIKALRSEADIDLMVQAVIDANMEDLCEFQHGAISYLLHVRSLSKRIGLCYLGTGNTYQNALPLKDYGPVSLAWDYSSIIAYPDIVQFCEDNNFELIAWTINLKDRANYMTKLGVHKLMADVNVKGVFAHAY